jgi:hypothetical protein
MRHAESRFLWPRQFAFRRARLAIVARRREQTIVRSGRQAREATDTERTWEEKRKDDELNRKTKGGENMDEQSSLCSAVDCATNAWGEGPGGKAPRTLSLGTRLR